MTEIGSVYTHYKGGQYLVIGLAWESTNGRERKPVVIYVSLEKQTINVRDEYEFHSFVDEQATRHRFTLTGRPNLESQQVVEKRLSQTAKDVLSGKLYLGDALDE